jgi:hypothetical protein
MLENQAGYLTKSVTQIARKMQVTSYNIDDFDADNVLYCQLFYSKIGLTSDSCCYLVVIFCVYSQF